MKKSSIFLSAILVLFVGMMSTSCVSRKKLVYFQGSDTLYSHPQQISQQYEMKLKPADQVLVKITHSGEPELLSPFAQDVTMGSLRNNSTYSNAGTLSNAYGYTVTNNGELILPAVGNVYVDNMTCEEAARAIEKKVVELNLLQQPEVTVRLMNARVTVVGAVRTPRSVSLTSERNTVIDVLAQCGDLDVTSLRKNIKLFREVNGERQMYTLDLTDVNIFNNPAFYVQQNDMIYVEPNKSKNIRNSAFYTFLGVAGGSIFSLASVAISVIALTKR